MEVAEGCHSSSAVPVHTTFFRKAWRKVKREPAFWGSRAKKGIRNKFKKLKACPKGENRKDHKLWQTKCKNALRVAKKKDFEEQITKITQTTDSFVGFL